MVRDISFIAQRLLNLRSMSIAVGHKPTACEYN
jgi:hypothetical protein